jgi:Tat protein secretion system quality control protein TatD with DNase activity
VVHTGACLAAALGMPAAEFAAATTANARRLLRLP